MKKIGKGRIGSFTLDTLTRAAEAVGRQLRMELV
jgi:hypothetical protein